MSSALTENPPLITVMAPSTANLQASSDVINNTAIGNYSKVTPGMSVITKTYGKSSTHLSLNVFPVEIRMQIWKWALTAPDGKFDFTDLTSKFKPNVATALLRVNHEIYHDARDLLYSENNFIFNDLGSDVRILAQPRGIWSCKAAGCKSSEPLTIKEVTLCLGDNDSPANGELKLRCLAAALERLRCQVNIKKLNIYLRHECWGKHTSPATLFDGLSKINVTGELNMFGADHHWMKKMRLVPKALQMNLEPIETALITANPPLFCVGFFKCCYKPANTSEESEEHEGQVIKDAGYAYEQWRNGLSMLTRMS